MGFSVILLGMVLVVLLAVSVIAFIIVQTFGNGAAPLKLSYISFGLLVMQWILFLTDFYAIFPNEIGDVVFMPAWFIACGFGAIAIIREWKNNSAVAVVLAVLTGLSFIMAVFINGIGNM
ncbi:hypothetical protein F9U64_06550 [Gracilibacillus oryzae]|uniref:Ammonia permease n=1 Tax=Gracilibacillus oryzae TaxID=1672701 RepID=A0A7C8KTJ9_9BACI|nr:hypothetical protein [Gracilibacillus oryzae]KAB8138100.1 hypothetical protein F9U64_06550 [Gracilibacillus oryzae]